jgi:hypothetical protein
MFSVSTESCWPSFPITETVPEIPVAQGSLAAQLALVVAKLSDTHCEPREIPCCRAFDFMPCERFVCLW